MTNAPPDISGRHLRYADLDTPLTGFLCQAEHLTGDQPGILLIHGGAGLDEHARQQARRYAALGYTVLACDMFGDGIAGDRDRVINCLMALRDDPAFLVRRARAGLAALAATPGTSGPAAAVGFCFGGLAALQLARSGHPWPPPSASTAAWPPARRPSRARPAPGCWPATAPRIRTSRSATSPPSPTR
ncbi:MAG: dienelactone hydrolase family protein [Streptosporangiaceae bacterium]